MPCSAQLSSKNSLISLGPGLVVCYCRAVTALRKHAYSNILKILPPKKEKFQIKKLWYVSYFAIKK